jgi:hypothetical protein
MPLFVSNASPVNPNNFLCYIWGEIYLNIMLSEKQNKGLVEYWTINSK